MSGTACLVGRTAIVSLRKKGPAPRPDAREVTVAFPARWTRARFLKYVRQEHPEDACLIVEWHPVSESGGGWDPSLWIANPAAFADYKTGTLK